MYCPNWQVGVAGDADVAAINPETLTDVTPADFKFRYIDISSVSESHINWNSVETVRFADAPSRARRVLRQGDSLICTVRPMLKSHAFAEWTERDDYICSTGFAVVRSGKKLNPQFLKHLPFSEQVGRQLVAWQCGTNYPAVNERDIRKLRLPLPSLDEQASIARILGAVDTAIAQTREAVERARVLDHSLLHELLERGVTSERSKKRPAHWQIKRVDEVAEVGSGVTLGRDVSGMKYVELPYLRVANVQDGHLDLGTIKTVKVPVNEVDRYRLQPGDVLMTEGGDLDKLGRGTLWEGQIPDCLHQNHIFRVRANRAMLDPYYFAYLVESDIAKRYFMRVAKRTTNLASTNKTQVRAFRFPVPPLPEQRRIAGIITAAKKTLQGFIEKEKSLRQLKQSLMHDLLTGKVRANHLAMASEIGA
ncbi:MAG: restriction endonuclease subunit S [Blastocatellales bacterium]